MQVRLVERPIGVPRDLHGVGLDCAPEVGNLGIEVIDRFVLRLARTIQKDCERARKRLDVVGRVAECAPYDFSDTTLGDEVRPYGNGARSAVPPGPFLTFMVRT